MHKVAALLIISAVLNSAYAANITSPVCQSGSAFTNCASCDSASASTYCTSCNPGYQLSVSTSGGATGCSVACPSSLNCQYCNGETAGKAAASANTVTSAATACIVDNNPAPTAVTYATAVCKNTTGSGTTASQFIAWYTPGAVSSNTYPCYACPSNCINCRQASGTAPSSSSAVTSCLQCTDGYYLSSNNTADSTTGLVSGTCTACPAFSSGVGISSSVSSSSASASTVTVTCNKCVTSSKCVNATCTKVSASSSGTSSTDTTSYTWDVVNQKCVSKSSAAKLSVAVFGLLAAAMLALF